MKPFYLSEITTKDGLIHQGIFFSPKNPGKRAILWVHGLTGRFYGDPIINNAFAEECETQGWGFAAFNNRGHDVIANVRKIDKRKKTGFAHTVIGAGAEKFIDCIYDIDAAIGFLENQGFSEIILVGHSTGANKACYYAATQKDPCVVGVVLSGPLSDRYASGYTPETYEKYREFMEKKIVEGKGDELLEGYNFFALTPNRWVSLYVEGSAEDVFNYSDGDKALTQFIRIAIPLMVINAGNDEHAHISIQEIKRLFDSHTRSNNYKSIIIPGVLHGFEGKEKEVVNAIIEWVKTI